MSVRHQLPNGPPFVTLKSTVCLRSPAIQPYVSRFILQSADSGENMPPHECGIDRPVRVSLTSLAGSATEVGAGAFYFDAHECCAGEDPLHRLSQATL